MAESLPNRYIGYDHVRFYVSNAKQAASFHILRLGFEACAYAGLETGARDYATHVVRQGSILYAFTSFLNAEESELGRRVMLRGDAPKEVAFRVTDCKYVYEKAIERGAVSVRPPTVETDEHGSVMLATIQAYGDVWHTFVQRVIDGREYAGVFLPEYVNCVAPDPLGTLLPPAGLTLIDHLVGNQPNHGMEPVVRWYERVLDFHRFWSIDDDVMHTEFSALRFTVVADPEEVIKMPINEPARGKRKSQIQEFVEYNGGAGVQHIAFRTDNIIHTVANLRARGLEFLRVPDTYYEDLRVRIAKHGFDVTQSLVELQRLNILVDFDDKGYLLQLFTKPVEDRPTMFYEIIQRCGCAGFGAGNIKALFQAIEVEQARRGNLVAMAASPIASPCGSPRPESEAKFRDTIPYPQEQIDEAAGDPAGDPASVVVAVSNVARSP